MIKKNFLICLTGLPASGKTSFAHALKLILEKNLKLMKVNIIDPDEIRKKLYPEIFDPTQEQHVRNKNVHDIKHALQEGFIVISDDLNYYTSMRHDLKEISENVGVTFYIVHISTPFERCLKWNEKRGKPIPDQVIFKIREKFDAFGKYSWDYPDAIYDLSQYDNLDDVAEDFLDIIMKDSMGSRNSELEKAKINYNSNLDHERIDRITRMVVGEILQNPESLSKKKDILEYRKKYIKASLNKSLSKLEIITSFKEYLEKKLKI
jgi:tRNA uridine 5-carbamoylmethylation protein Kti12